MRVICQRLRAASLRQVQVSHRLAWCGFLLPFMALTALTPAFGADGDMAELRRLSNGFGSVFQAVSPSVVHVRSETRRPGSETKKPTINHGSGFIFEPSRTRTGGRHYILTSHHIVEHAGRITVQLRDGREFEANLTGTDQKTDIAVIDIGATDVQPLKTTDSARLQVGQWVLAIGSPFGLKHSLTVGVVSGIGRTSVGINDYEDFIQTDASINPGNSGGPLVNLDGQVVGVNATVLTGGGDYMGAAFAIPINFAQSVANQLIENGEVNRAYLGVFLQPLTHSLATALGLPDTRGALVSEVAAGSPAAMAGVREGDVIRRFQNMPIRDVGSFINDLSLSEPDSQASMDIVRDKKPLTLTVELANRRQFERPPVQPNPSARLLGLTVEKLNRQLAVRFNISMSDHNTDNRLIVSAVVPGSGAERAGIEPGAILLQVERQPVASVDEFHRHMRASRRNGHALLLIRHNNNQQFVVLFWN